MRNDDEDSRRTRPMRVVRCGRAKVIRCGAGARTSELDAFSAAESATAWVAEMRGEAVRR